MSQLEQVEAAHFGKSLLKIKKLIKEGELNTSVLKNKFKMSLLVSKKITLDYISIADKKTLTEIDIIQGDVLISAAIFFNQVRLIDNFTYHSST